MNEQTSESREQEGSLDAQEVPEKSRQGQLETGQGVQADSASWSDETRIVEQFRKFYPSFVKRKMRVGRYGNLGIVAEEIRRLRKIAKVATRQADQLQLMLDKLRKVRGFVKERRASAKSLGT